MDIRGHKITILGAVRSGIAAAKLADRNGAIPFVSDLQESDELKQSCGVLKEKNIEYELGKHSARIFDCDYIITSPGIPSRSSVIQEAIERGIKVISELEFASWFCEAKIIAITGTNGKTTTTYLCDYIINSSGIKCYTAGNIGLPFSDIVMDTKEGEYVALEVSSFQLDYIDKFKPTYSIILNITPDHLDRYEERFDLYIKSKMRIGENQTAGDHFIFNGDDENIPVGLISNEVNLLAFSLEKGLSNGSFIDEGWIVNAQNNEFDEVCNVAELKLKGEHNLLNSLAVINIAKSIGIENEIIKAGLNTFKGVEHRLEFVREINGITFINDSKATNVDSVWYALRSFHNSIYLILGGTDKGNDYNKIKHEVKKRVKKIYAIGSSANKVNDFFKNITEVEIIDNFNDVIKKVLIEASSGETVLLSPACASFDMFKNYEDRGEKFKQAVNNL